MATYRRDELSELLLPSLREMFWNSHMKELEQVSALPPVLFNSEPRKPLTLWERIEGKYDNMKHFINYVKDYWR